MLEKVREPWKASRTKSILAYVIFGMICLTFVVVGVTPNQGGGAGAGTAATVNDVVISLYDFQERVSMLENQMGSDKNTPAAQRQMRSRMVRENALNDLVNYELVYQSAERVGVLPTKAATREMIISVPFFQEEGRFAREKYTQFLAYKNTTAAEFENKLKRDVVIRQLRDMFVTALHSPQVLQKLEKEVREIKVNIEFVKFDAGELAKEIGKDSSAIQKFVSNPDNKTKIESYYGLHKEDFTTKPEVRARHILIKGSGDGVLKRIREIRAEAEKGDFSTLAKKYSEDEGSKANGGDLKFFARGQMVTEFENAAFSLPVGQLSEPVKTEYGYHLIKVEERRGGETKSLKDAENQIAQNIMADESKEQLTKEVTDLLKDKKDVSTWVAKQKLKWEETGDFGLDQNFVPKIQAGEEALEAALSLRGAGDIYPNLVRAGPAAYILRLKKVTKPSGAPDKSLDLPSSQLAAGGAETLGLWAEELKKSAIIQKNNALLN